MSGLSNKTADWLSRYGLPKEEAEDTDIIEFRRKERPQNPILLVQMTETSEASLDLYKNWIKSL